MEHLVRNYSLKLNEEAVSIIDMYVLLKAKDIARRCFVLAQTSLEGLRRCFLVLVMLNIETVLLF